METTRAPGSKSPSPPPSPGVPGEGGRTWRHPRLRPIPRGAPGPRRIQSAGMAVVVFHHGLLVPGRLTVVGRTVGAFVGIDRVFADRGHTAVVTQVHPTASIARRAGQLKYSILEWLKCLQHHPDASRDCDDGRVVIIAHSMGGLDAR